MAQIAKSTKSTQVLEYIFGALIILAILFVVYSIFVVS